MFSTELRIPRFPNFIDRDQSVPETGLVGTEEEVAAMCYNCGCEMPDNDMGNPKNITDKTFQEAANAAGQPVEEAKKNALELLEKSLGKKK
jgi:hypothetical protein